MEMNELLEKAKRDYPKGTKFRGLIDGKDHICDGDYVIFKEDIYVETDCSTIYGCLYHADKNKWAEIIREETMNEQEFNSLKIGAFIGNYEVIHKYNEFLIVKCDDGHDLFDLAKINKLGLKITPKTFMGLEVKDYDNAPCEINEGVLFYLAEVRNDDVLIRCYKSSTPHSSVPTSIRIL